MIKPREGADKQFLNAIQDARKAFVDGIQFDKDQSWAARIVISPEMMDDDHYLFYVVRRLIEQERDAIYRAVVYSGGEWTAIRSRFMARNKWELMGAGMEFAVQIDASVADRKVYVPVYDYTAMPRDVFKCNWCGGYTKNDMRGHCAGCGGPRDESYIAELERQAQ